MAIARARWRLEGHLGADGQALPPREGILVHLLARSGDGTGAGWKIIDSQNTDIVDGVLSRPQ